MATVGETTTVPNAGGVVPELVVQTNGPDPETVKVCDDPEQIEDIDGVIIIAGVVEIETVATAVEVHVPVPERTV